MATAMNLLSNSGWFWNPKGFANTAGGTPLDFRVAGYRSQGECFRIDPNVVIATVVVQLATIGTQVFFEGAAVHGRSCPLSFRELQL